MSSNIFISYDLHQPVRNYERVIHAIKTCGTWAHVQKSLWYVSGSLTMEQVFLRLSTAIDIDDSLIVIDASTNDAKWTGVNPEVARLIQGTWQQSSQVRRFG